MLWVNALDENSVVVRLRGGLDAVGAAKLKQSLHDLEDAEQPLVVIDLAEVDFIDSTGLSVLIGFQRRLGPQRRLALANVRPVVSRLLAYTGVEEVFEILAAGDLTASAEDPVTSEEDPTLRPTPQSGNADLDAGAVEAHAAVAAAQPAAWQSAAPDDPRLSRDAATVLGIAGSALPFAAEVDDQAERWLRLLRHHGDAGILLGSLGISDEPTRPEARGARSEKRPDTAAQADPVALVTGQARTISRSRGADSTHTKDVLQAVREIYGSAFEDALVRHASEPDVVVHQLDQLLANR